MARGKKKVQETPATEEIKVTVEPTVVEAKAPETPTEDTTPKEDAPSEPTPEVVEEKKVRNVRTNKDNRSNGKFALVRRNDNRIRLTSDGKTIATIQVGTKVCSIHTATKDVFEVLTEEVQKKVEEKTMGPNSYKLSVKTEEVDTVARTLFGECEELIIEKKEEEAASTEVKG